ncbi:MAG: hypothetical protein IPM37_03710 [Hahellaceae bacterium]|nr:hypothetical protein [Hahellaceae bacterium]
MTKNAEQVADSYLLTLKRLAGGLVKYWAINGHVRKTVQIIFGLGNLVSLRTTKAQIDNCVSVA